MRSTDRNRRARARQSASPRSWRQKRQRIEAEVQPVSARHDHQRAQPRDRPAGRARPGDACSLIVVRSNAAMRCRMARSTLLRGSCGARGASTARTGYRPSRRSSGFARASGSTGSRGCRRTSDRAAGDGSRSRRHRQAEYAGRSRNWRWRSAVSKDRCWSILAATSPRTGRRSRDPGRSASSGPAPTANHGCCSTSRPAGSATSGDTHRFVERDGVRYGHILDVRTGWPVRSAPRSVTVAAATCVEAGMLATLAMLKGAGAEQFLAEQGVDHWCLR